MAKTVAPKSAQQRPASAPARTSSPVAPKGGGGLSELQRSVGNQALAALLGQGSPVADAPGIAIQRDAVDSARKLLSYGLFDWAITDADATKAFNLLAEYKGSQAAAVSRLGPKYIERLFDNLPRKLQVGSKFVGLLRASPARFRDGWLNDLPRGAGLTTRQKQTLFTLFRVTSDAEIPLLKRVFEIRFDVITGADMTEATGTEWDAPGLRQSWTTLNALPPGHVEGNSDFKKYLRYAKSTGMGGGYYQGGGSDIVSMNYASGNASMTQANTSDAGDSLNGVNRFNKVVRHEIGHAVDSKMGWSDGSEPGKAARGGWKTYGSSLGTVFAEMISASAGGIAALSAGQKEDVIDEMKWVAANNAGGQLLTRIKALDWWAALEAPKKTAVESDKVIAAMQWSLVGKNPWYKAPGGGIALGGRIYEESYDSDWSSYLQSARAQKVSQYQFRAPGEWFAEAYAAYYEPSREKGARLAQNDPASKKYFDESVDPIR